jgi:hypothetical protein
MNGPRDEMTDAFELARRLVAVFAAAERRRTEDRQAARRTPEARAKRSEAARLGWETRWAREAREAKADAEADWRPAVPPGPHCLALDHDSTGREVHCLLPPHDGGECDDLNGHTWTDD